MHWQPRRQRFRQHLTSNRCVFPASVYDALSARMASELDYEVGMFAGSIASLAVLGDPDLILLTLTEFAEQAYRINRASDLPLLVDADHGYGNALNVKRTVEELETAGVAALSIEDTDLPRPFGSGGVTQLTSLAEGVGKMKAAVAGRQDSDLVIAARTSAVKINGLDDALQRIEAYQDTGVDMIFLIGVENKTQMEKIARVCRLPLILGGASAEVKNLDYLSDMGVSICLQGHQPFMAAAQATYSTLKALRDGVAPANLSGQPDKADVNKWSNADNFSQWTKEFLDD